MIKKILEMRISASRLKFIIFFTVIIGLYIGCAIRMHKSLSKAGYWDEYPKEEFTTNRLTTQRCVTNYEDINEIINSFIQKGYTLVSVTKDETCEHILNFQ